MNEITPAAAVQSGAISLAESHSGLVIQEGPAALMTAIMQLASNPAMDLDKFERLIARQERAEDRQSERAFNIAFVRLQGRLPRIKRDGSLEYPAEKNKPEGPKRAISKYAKWETIDAGIRPVLTEEGFGLSFKIGPRAEGGLNVSAVLRHIGGYKEVGDPFPVPLDTSGGKNNLQAYGSSLSYGKKYAAFAALNIITENEDTDGNRQSCDPGLITADQVEELRQLMHQTRITEDTVLAKMAPEVRTIEALPPAEFVRVRNALLSRKNVLKQRWRLAVQQEDAARAARNGVVA